MESANGKLFKVFKARQIQFKRYKKLSSTPTKEDLEAVAARLLALRWNALDQQWDVSGLMPPRDFIKMVVGYALTCKMRLPAVASTIIEARHQARKHGRSTIAAVDIRAALFDYQIPSDEALQQAFQPVEKRRELTIHALPGSVALPLQRRCTSVA